MPKIHFIDNELASIIYQARSSGLEIYAIRDLSKEDL